MINLTTASPGDRFAARDGEVWMYVETDGKRQYMVGRHKTKYWFHHTGEFGDGLRPSPHDLIRACEDPAPAGAEQGDVGLAEFVRTIRRLADTLPMASQSAKALEAATRIEALFLRATKAEAALEDALRAERERLAEKISTLAHHSIWLPYYGYTIDQEPGQRLADGMVKLAQDSILRENRRQDWEAKQDALRDAGEPYFDWRAAARDWHSKNGGGE